MNAVPAVRHDAARRMPTPNHPEYPAAHSCTSGALGASLRHLHGTPEVTFSLDSTVTGTTRTYAGADAFNQENRMARIAGEELGKRVADWVATHHFQRQ